MTQAVRRCRHRLCDRVWHYIKPRNWTISPMKQRDEEWSGPIDYPHKSNELDDSKNGECCGNCKAWKNGPACSRPLCTCHSIKNANLIKDWIGGSPIIEVKSSKDNLIEDWMK